MMMNDAISQFRAAIQTSGLIPPDVILPGRMHRFPGIGKRSGNRAGWCTLFEDGLGGCFGDWSSGFTSHWHAQQDIACSRSHQAVITHRREKARQQAEAERQARQSEAARRASTIWHEATPVSCLHPYLRRKRIRSHGAKAYKGALTLPVMDFTDTLTSLQFIAANGDKQLLSGGRKKGCFIPVAGDMTNPSRIIICEGWATGCTLAEVEPDALVLTAIDAGNLEPVSLSVRLRWPAAELVIAGDDDRLTAGNPGASKARAAAIASGALLALPQWPEDAPNHLTDFNDLAVWLAGGEA